jgi:phosphoglycerate dehydrogenase-like enzyme
MLRVAFAGIFPASLEEPVRRHLAIPCDIIVADEVGIISQLAEIDVLVTMELTAEMGRTSTRLKLVQVPGAGLDRIDRSALPRGHRWRMSTGTRRASPNM